MAVSQELRIIIRAIDQASAGLKAVKSETASMGKGFADAAQDARPLGIALTAVGAAGVALIGTATMTAARVEVLGTVLDTVGGNAGYSRGELALYEEGVKSLGITTGAARQGLVRLAQAEIDLSYATDLARMAQDAAVIANINSSEAYERLVTVVQRGSPVMARTLGLNVDFAASYRRMADQLGKSTLELTANEKMQARLNEVLAQGSGIAGAYVAAMDDVGKRLTSLPRLYEEAAVALGESYLPLLGDLVTAQEDVLKGFIDLEPEQQTANARFLGIGTAVAAAGGGLILVVPKIAAAITALKALNIAAAGAGIALGPIGLVAGGLAAVYAITQLPVPAGVAEAAMVTLSDASTMLAEDLYGLEVAEQAVAETSIFQRRAVEDVAGLYRSAYTPQVRAALDATEGFTESVGENARGLDQQALAAKRVEDAVRAQADALNVLTLAIAGPVKQANEEYTQELGAIEAQIEANIRALAGLDPAHEEYDQAVRDSRGELHDLRMGAAELAADHKEAINSIIYDMILAQLALDGWTAAELDFALETGRSMGLVDEASYIAGKAIMDAFSQAREDGLLPTVDAMHDIRDAAMEIPVQAAIAGAEIASGLQPGIEALGVGIHTAEQLSATILGLPSEHHISIYWDHYGRPPSGEYGGGGGGGGRQEDAGDGGNGGGDRPPSDFVPGRPAYQQGTDFVPRTGWAWMHRGEAVTPAGQNARGRPPVIINQYFGKDSVRSDQDLIDIADATRNAQMLRGAPPVL